MRELKNFNWQPLAKQLDWGYHKPRLSEIRQLLYDTVEGWERAEVISIEMSRSNFNISWKDGMGGKYKVDTDNPDYIPYGMPPKMAEVFSEALNKLWPPPPPPEEPCAKCGAIEVLSDTKMCRSCYPETCGVCGWFPGAPVPENEEVDHPREAAEGDWYRGSSSSLSEELYCPICGHLHHE